MELSSQDITIIVKELNKSLESYYVSKVNAIGDRAIRLKMRHSTKSEKDLIMTPGQGIWLTKYQIKTEGKSKMLYHIRKQIERSKFISAEQPKNERLVFLRFQSHDETSILILELFGEGNIVVTDNDMRIIGIEKTLRVRHRELRRNSIYSLPPSSRLELSSINRTHFATIKESDARIIQWIGRNITTSKKYIEEIMNRTEINTNHQCSEINNDEIEKICENISKLDLEFKKDKQESYVWYLDGKAFEASPFNLNIFKEYEFKEFSNFNEAIDEVLSLEFIKDKLRDEAKSVTSKLERLKWAINDQQKARKHFEISSNEMKIFATELMSLGTNQTAQEYLKEKGIEVKKPRREICSANIATFNFEFAESILIKSLSSMIFKKSKELDNKAKSIVEAEQLLQDKINKMADDNETDGNSSEPTEKREKEWYERFRWFYTTEGKLAIGGRDASSNSALIRKHLSNNDLVFHADVHGSPFFILKDGKESNTNSKEEVSQTVISYSSAWRSGALKGDAYWINPDQVKKQAPSGMYLVKGSFLITGKKNYARNIDLKVSIGFIKKDEHLVILGGSPEAIKTQAMESITIIPEKGKTSDTAKQVKSKLIEITKSSDTTLLKRTSIDEFMKVIPTSGGKIVNK